MAPTMGRFLTAAILLVGFEAAALAEDPAPPPVSTPETPTKKPPMAWPLWTMHAVEAVARRSGRWHPYSRRRTASPPWSQASSSMTGRFMFMTSLRARGGRGAMHGSRAGIYRSGFIGA